MGITVCSTTTSRVLTRAGLRKGLVDLFRVLDTKPQDRDPYLQDDNPELAAFPYVNGGLFSDENIEIPPFTDEIRNLLLNKASEDFNWSESAPRFSARCLKAP